MSLSAGMGSVREPAAHSLAGTRTAGRCAWILARIPVRIAAWTQPELSSKFPVEGAPANSNIRIAVAELRLVEAPGGRRQAAKTGFGLRREPKLRDFPITIWGIRVKCVIKKG